MEYEKQKDNKGKPRLEIIQEENKVERKKTFTKYCQKQYVKNAKGRTCYKETVRSKF